jgi:hypothetical protein
VHDAKLVQQREKLIARPTAVGARFGVLIARFSRMASFSEL